MADGKIGSYSYTIVEPGSSNYKRFQKKPYPKVIIEGINKKDGAPRRFRSVARATSYLKNLGLIDA